MRQHIEKYVGTPAQLSPAHFGRHYESELYYSLTDEFTWREAEHLGYFP